MIMKPHVRKRCTIAHEDKISSTKTVTNLKYCYDVIRRYSQNELNTLYNVSKNIETNKKKLKPAKEIHIHGRIIIDKDV